LRLHKSFESFSGSIGITLSTKYVEFPLLRASLSSSLPSLTYSATSAIDTIRRNTACSQFGGIFLEFFVIFSILIASSRSFASSPSIVKVSV
jgi:hypothetical protein